MKKQLKGGMLAGKKYKEVMELTLEGEIYEVEISPLGHNESGLVQSIMSRGVNIVGGGNPKADGSNLVIDNEKMVVSSYEAQLKAAANGTTDPFWDEVSISNEWPSDWIQEVGNRVMIISGIGNVDEVERFRAGRK